MAKPFRESWSNFILHLTGFLSRKKEGLIFVGAFKAIGLVLLIIGAEILLLVVSFPSYLALRDKHVTSASKEYKLRRVLTLGVVRVILIIWIIKLVIILTLSWQANREGEFPINQTFGRGENIETAADEVLVAPVDGSIPPPEIISHRATHKGIIISGRAEPGHAVVFAFEREDGSGKPTFYTTWADDNGTFTLAEDSSVFTMPKGEYDVSAITYDQTKNAKSAESRSFPLEVKQSLSERLLYGADATLNVVALLAILVGLVATILVV